MKYKEALLLWRGFNLPMIIKTNEPDGILDKISRRESWLVYLDNLAKGGNITETQCEAWGCCDDVETIGPIL